MPNIFTFWEGPMPAYIKLCMQTWHFEFEILNFSNLHKYTDIQIDARLKRFTLPQIADVVRVHVLRDNGGYWLDADTIMVCPFDKLPTETIMGNPYTRSNTIGYLHAERPHMDFFEQWAAYQDKVLADPHALLNWDVMGNAFTDWYVKNHPEVTIADVSPCWPETYMIDGAMSRREKYVELYFKRNNGLLDLKPTDMLMLHNSWTPDWYKHMYTAAVLSQCCTLSHILQEINNGQG